MPEDENEMNPAEFQQLLNLIEKNRRDIVTVRDDIIVVKKAVVGNGDYDKSLLSRVQLLELKIGSAPTWQWLIEKSLLPLLMTGVGILVGLLISHVVP